MCPLRPLSDPPVDRIDLDLRARCLEMGGAFLRLGCLGFGGPVAHLGHLRAEFVERRRWLDEGEYAELVALCQFLPGPASSQVVFALGMRRGGLAGALVASLCFTLPAACLMIGAAVGLSCVGTDAVAGARHGLTLAAVAVVAQAVWAMGRRLCPDVARRTLCLSSALALLAAPDTGAVQVGVMALAGASGWWIYRDEQGPAARVIDVRAHLPSVATLAVYGGLLVALPWLASVTRWHPLAVFDSFYRVGALVFGGGHVVLPLLRAEVVPRGWVTEDHFVAGYALAQAVPGPMFSFAGFLGAAMATGSARWSNGLWCLFAIFLPSWLLIGGALPWWTSLRAHAGVRAFMAGTHAAVVGMLLAALYDPLLTEGIAGVDDLVVVILALWLLERARAPAWGVVLGCAGLGQWVLPA